MHRGCAPRSVAVAATAPSVRAAQVVSAVLSALPLRSGLSRPVAKVVLLMPADQFNLRWIKQAIVQAKLRDPTAPHHYRGVAEMPQPRATQAHATEAASPASPCAPANAAAPPRPAEGPAKEERAAVSEASSRAAAVASRSTDAADDGRSSEVGVVAFVHADNDRSALTGWSCEC